jgi:4,5-DOPA dioxygenase extradiol
MGAQETGRMPVLFIGHGNPMNAIEDNAFSREWAEAARKLPRPKAILCVSAHWETSGTLLTVMERPRTIHDFGGFPKELFAVQYPASGSRWLVEETRRAVRNVPVGTDSGWGLDHGCWSVLIRMFPDADVPVVQLSLDRGIPGERHYELARELAPLRRKGVLILASGNMVHNLGRIEFRGGPDGFNAPFGLDWALEASALFRKLIVERRHGELADYPSLGKAVRLAVPTPEHYLPMLYALALQEEDESVEFFNDVPVAGSLTMTCLRIDRTA